MLTRRRWLRVGLRIAALTCRTSWRSCSRSCSSNACRATRSTAVNLDLYTIPRLLTTFALAQDRNTTANWAFTLTLAHGV